ncbi:MAG: hypothetical protein INH43_08175 [Acidobacteriaceae bacterium]|nr:hypothetical protein [Acidobacteriaceae bacterium]
MSKLTPNDKQARKATYLLACGASAFFGAIVIGMLFPGSLIPFVFFAGGIIATVAGGIASTIQTGAAACSTFEPKTPASSRPHAPDVEPQVETSREQLRPSQTPSGQSLRQDASVNR